MEKVCSQPLLRNLPIDELLWAGKSAGCMAILLTVTLSVAL
jgi:hypothetical protein